jgi:hypothetical protein
LSRAATLAAISAASILALLPAPARAQASGEACRSSRISPEKAVDFATAYEAALPRAKEWRGDAVFTRASHTFRPLDDEGRTRRWTLEFYSEGARETAAMKVEEGVLSCQWSVTSRSVEPPPLSPGFVKDVKRVLAEGAAHGGAELLAKGWKPEVELKIGSLRRIFRFTLWDPIRYYWFVSYLHPTDRKVLLVTLDANDGSFVRSETYKTSR